MLRRRWSSREADLMRAPHPPELRRWSASGSRRARDWSCWALAVGPPAGGQLDDDVGTRPGRAARRTSRRSATPSALSCPTGVAARVLRARRPHPAGAVIRRVVLAARLGVDGTPIALGNRGESWSPRSACDVASDISAGRFSYVVPWGGAAAVVTARRGDGGAWLLEAPGPDGAPGGLALLPSC